MLLITPPTYQGHGTQDMRGQYAISNMMAVGFLDKECADSDKHGLSMNFIPRKMPTLLNEALATGKGQGEGRALLMVICSVNSLISLIPTLTDKK